MAKGYKIKGLSEIQKKLKQLPGKIKNEVIADIQDTADTIVMKAINKAPVDLGVLKQSIGNEPKKGGLNYIVFVGVEYAAPVEFGTGTETNIPAELKDYAKQFKGEGKKNINLPAQPFFFTGYFEERDKLLKTLRKNIAKHL